MKTRNLLCPTLHIGAIVRQASGLLPLIGALLFAGCARFHPHPLSPEVTAAGFQSRSLTNLDLRDFLASNGEPGEWPRPVWDLSSLTLASFYYQPGLAVARAQWATAKAGQVTAGERPNPTVSVTPGYDSGIPDNPSPWLVPLTFDFPIETAGKRGYRMVQAQHLSAAARWKVIGTIWQVRNGVRVALLNLYSAEQTRLLQVRQEEAQSNVVRLMQGQLAAGTASGFELTQARVALDTTRLSEQDAQRLYAQARSQLASAVGVPDSALVGVRLSFDELETLPARLTNPQVRRQALLNRADVRGALAEYAAAQAALQLAIAGQYPDVHLGPGYAWNAGSAGDSEWQLGLSVTLPVLNQNQGAIAEAEAKRRETAMIFLAIQAQATASIDSALAGYHPAMQESATATALLHNLESRLNSVRAMEQAGETDALAVANAQVEFNAGALLRLDALVKAEQALGALEDAVQSPLTLPEPVISNALDASSEPTSISKHER